MSISALHEVAQGNVAHRSIMSCGCNSMRSSSPVVWLSGRESQVSLGLIPDTPIPSAEESWGFQRPLLPPLQPHHPVSPLLGAVGDTVHYS